MTDTTNQLHLEKAELDFSSVRTQIVFAMVCVLGSCLCNHGNHIFALSAWFCLCLVLALVTLEITGRFGNRLGASASCWAALLFSAYPLHYEPGGPVADYDDLLFTLFVAVSVFGLLRFSLVREIKYAGLAAVSALAAAALVVFTGSWNAPEFLAGEQNSMILGLAHFQNFLLPAPLGNQPGFFKTLLLGIYTVLLFLLLVRLALRKISLKILLILLVFAALAAGSPTLFSFLLCLLLSFMALPVIDHTESSKTKISGYAGILCLSLLFLSWCQIDRTEQKCVPPSAIRAPSATLPQ
jgi:hypothetical protein